MNSLNTSRANQLVRLSCACALMAFAPTALNAHELVRVRANPEVAEVGQVVQIGIEFRPRENLKVCGLNIDFGDGTSDYLRAQGSNPSGAVSHIYKQPGEVVIKVEGNSRMRGLNSIFACSGSGKAAAVKVLPSGYAERRAAAEAEEKQAALQRAQAETQAALQQAQAETRAAQAEAARQRSLAEQTTQRAAREKAAADKLGRENAAQRQAVPEPVAKQKSDQAKPKSSLDL